MSCVYFESVLCVYSQSVLCEVFSPCYECCLEASDPRSARVGSASRPQAISPNIIVFVVRGLTFMNVSALAQAVTS